MVIYEAAKAMCALPVDARDLSQAIVVLQLFLGSSKPTLRFAAVRTLSQVALTQPMLVTRCNEDMEALISDSNRSIATLAITTLLKTGRCSLTAVGRKMLYPTGCVGVTFSTCRRGSLQYLVYQLTNLSRLL